jgi:hypothetical protein
MTMKRIMIGLALLAGTVLAQTNVDPNERVQKLVPVKYVDPNAVQLLLMNFGVEMRADQRLRTVALTGRRSALLTAEEAIKQLDEPGAAQKDIELTVYFVVGAEGPSQPDTAAIPQEIQSTVATLKSTFPFKNYYLLDTLGLRSRSGVGAEAGGQLTGNRFTSFKIGSVTVEPDGAMIRLDRLHAGLRIPHQGGDGKLTYIDTGVTTEVVDVKEGQKLVVGRSSLDGPGKALFLVLIAKIVQ